MNIEVSIEGFDRLLKINKKMVTGAVRSAIDQTATKIGKEISTGIKERYAINPLVRKRQNTKPYKTRTSQTSLRAIVGIKGKRGLLQSWSARPFNVKVEMPIRKDAKNKNKKKKMVTMPGVKVKIVKASGRLLVKKAFIATMASGHTGVFTRRTDLPLTDARYTKNYRAGKTRMTHRLRELYSLSAPSMTKANMKKLGGIANGLSNKFAKELQARLAKINAKRRS